MNRSQYLRARKLEGRKVFGVFPAQYPKELLWAFDILPVEIWDPKPAACEAGRYIQPFVCSVVRAGLELILQGKADFLDGFFFPHTCDSIQNLMSIVQSIRPDIPCWFLYHPRAPHGLEAESFYAAQLEGITRQLGERFGTVSPEKYADAVEAGRRINSLLREVYERRASGELGVTNREFYDTLRLGEFQTADDYEGALTGLLRRGESLTACGDGTLPILVSGVLANPPELLDRMDELGIRIVADDFINLGRRIPSPKEGSKGSPSVEMISDYFSLPPCSTRGFGIEERVLFLTRLLERSRAEAVIFWTTKFCEPELFDLPPLTKELGKRGVRVLHIETELNEGVSAQVATRLEAFVETVNRERGAEI